MGGAGPSDGLTVRGDCRVTAEAFDNGIEGSDFASALVNPHIVVGQFAPGTGAVLNRRVVISDCVPVR